MTALRVALPGFAEYSADSCTYRLEHLQRMSDERGLFEHAEYDAPRAEHGYCTDDNARLLVVASREPDEGLAHDLSRSALRFVLSAQTDTGLVHNRLYWDGACRWLDDAGLEDWWGRALWGLGVAASSHPNSGVRSESLLAFRLSALAPRRYRSIVAALIARSSWRTAGPYSSTPNLSSLWRSRQSS